MISSAQSDPGCRICGGNTLPHLLNVRGHNLHRCSNCGFVQVTNAPSATELEAIYREAYFGHSKYQDQATLRAENQRRLGLLRQYVGGGGQVLEAGCGDGSFLYEAKPYYKMQGFDLAPAGVNLARAKNPDIAQQIWVSPLETLDLPNAYFDAICLWDVIEHIWNPRMVADHLLCALKPGGLLLLSTPNIDTVIARLMGKRWAFMTPPEHLSFFSQASIHQLFVNQLQAELVAWSSRGKRANLGFILYKLRRVFPMLPAFIPRLFEIRLLASLAIYVPSGDVQYVVIRKR
jgi:2-polyprenyl-3-methyl-5-hydroxy-6-metoxy-1,4-benzoquinol methylase